MKLFIITITLSAFCFNLKSQTHGTLSFNATTLNYTAQFSPKHILAIWIADSNGQWVKTRKLRSQNLNYRIYLTNFKNATNSTYNTVDAITGSTLTQHTSHSVTWDCKDINGNIVPDGTYRVYIEFTSANTTGKLYYIEFIKGPDIQTLTPSNQTSFSNITLNWNPTITNIESFNETSGIYIYPNPAKDNLNIVINNNNKFFKINILNSLGESIYHDFHNQYLSGIIKIDINNFENGIYFIEIETDSKKINKKILILK